MGQDGPVPSKHVNLYDFTTLPVYGRYFISPIARIWLGGVGGRYISKGGTGACAGRMAGTEGPNWEGVRTAVGDGGWADGDRENIFWW